MSFNRSIYDVCSYKYQLAQEVSPGIYQLVRPDNQSVPILPKDPRYIAQSSGVSIAKNTSLIDIDSELIGLSRNLSRCPDRKYMPDQNASFHCGAQTGKVRKPQGGLEVSPKEAFRNGCQPTAKLCVDNTQVMNFGDNGLWSEDTRLSNPACTLRGTGWNRWEWLPKDPQERCIEEFDYQIDSKIVSKDNHRPCLPMPIDQFNVYPVPNNVPICETIQPVCHAPTLPPSVSWQREGIVSLY
jgi:hypothetical protein